MKITPKIISLLLVLAMSLTFFAACNSSKPKDTESDKQTDEQTEAGTENGTDGVITVYEDKEYKVSFIRHELAEQTEKNYYNDIRAIFKSHTGKAISSATDFVSGGATLSNDAAVLVGKTDYPESTELYNSLLNNQAVAKMVGNKYVIAYSSFEALDALIVKLTDIVKRSSKSKIIINDSWNMEVTLTDVVDTNDLPTYNGKPFTTNVGAGQGSRVLVERETNVEEYNAYLTALKAAGFEEYATNTLEQNLFATYTNDKYIVNAMFLPAMGATKIMVDHRERFGLPGKESENVYTKTDKPTEFTQLGLAAISGSAANGMGYVVKLTDGRFVIVDGGYAYNTGGGANSAKFILDTLKKMADDPTNIVIAAWIVTHIHTDHAGGFMGMGNAYPNEVTIENLIYNQPSDAQMVSCGIGERIKWMSTAIENFEKAKNPIKNIVKAHPGQQFFFCDLTITIVGTLDLLEPHTLISGNNSSIVSMFEMNGGKVLLTGDCEPAEGRAIRDIFGGIDNLDSYLKSDFIQLAHHGYGNTKTESNPDRSALNVMSQAPYALIPVAHTALPGNSGGYESAVKHMIQNNIWDEDHRIIADNTNVTISFNTDGTHTIGERWESRG